MQSALIFNNSDCDISNLATYCTPFGGTPKITKDLSEVFVSLKNNQQINNLVIFYLNRIPETFFTVLNQCKTEFPYLNIFLVHQESNLIQKFSQLFRQGIDFPIYFSGIENLTTHIGKIFQKYFVENNPQKEVKFTLVPEEFAVIKNGEKIKLRKKEFELLDFLNSNRNKILEKSVILEAVWGYHNAVFTRTLEVHWHNLKRKLDTNPYKRIFKTIHGRGYQLQLSAPNIN